MADKLDALQSQIATLQKKQEALRGKAIAELRARIAAIGATAEELFAPATKSVATKRASVSEAPAGKQRGRPAGVKKAGRVKSGAGVTLTPSGREKKAPTHKDPESDKTWNGMGPMPKWLKAYANPDDLRI